MAVIVSVVFGLLVYPIHVAGVRFPGCSSNRLQVDERTDTVITCDQIGTQDTVGWFYGRSDQSDTSLGTCTPAGQCSPLLYTLSRISTQSNVTITSRPINFTRKLTKIICGEQGDPSSRAQCALDVVHPAELSSTSAKVEAKSGASWSIEGSIDITKTFSSRSQYKCQIYRGTEENDQPRRIIDKTYTTSLHTDTNYRTGSCTFRDQISNLLNQVTTRQDFYFRFTVYPGPTQVVKGPVTIERPATPTMTCPSIVPENSSFTCQCSTTNIGLPEGRLLWSLKNSVQEEGNYGDITLTTRTLRLQRADNGRTKLTCGIRWAAHVTPGVYTANVGYPPSRATLVMNLKSSLTVKENSDVSIYCIASESNPVSTLRLFNTQSHSLKEGAFPLTYSLIAQCQHSGLYTCTARNRFGGDVRDTATLYVSCKPRGEVNIGAVNFINNPVSATFDVIVYPTPDRFSFMFLGQNGTDLPTPVQCGITLEGHCTQTDLVYVSTCTVTVSNVLTAGTAGFYQVIVGNTIGTGSFKLQVKYKEETKISSNEAEAESGFSVWAGIGVAVAIMILIMILIVVVVVVWLWRQDWVLPCAETKRACGDGDLRRGGGLAMQQPVQPQHNDQQNTGVYELEESDGPNTPADLNATPSAYDLLQPSDIGVRSVYSSLPSPYYNAGATSDTGQPYVNKSETGPVYVNKDNSEDSTVYAN